MNVKDFIQRILTNINSENRSFSERVFILLTIISNVAVTIALIVDAIMGANILKIISLLIMVVVTPVLMTLCAYHKKFQLIAKIIIVGGIFIVLPMEFFLGGGAEGSGILWLLFAFFYIGMVLSGQVRNVMLSLMLVLALSCYCLEYFYPELVLYQNRNEFFIDSFISFILVSLVLFGMVSYQTRMFRKENEKAKKEAERVEELNQSQNRFFSSMSHEIRTPINSILGLNELILREENISDEVAKDALGIQGAGKMLLALINDILDFSKMKAGSMEIVPVDYNVGDLVSEIVNMIWLRSREKGLDLNVSVDPGVPSILYGDEVRIKQILINILNNAVKYTREGSIGFHIESETAGENVVLLRISVSDTGMGIKKDYIPYLFDAFKRVDEEKNRHIEGTGLGLSIVKQLVEMMDGSISVNSVYGEGSTFNVTIKQGVSDPTAIGELSIQNYGKVKKHAYECSFTAPEASVLIVDDNEMNLEVERKLLLGTKMHIDVATSGEKALEATVDTRYDIILMDHLMPEMDGIECLNQIRNQVGGLNQQTPVIILTANAGSDNKELYSHAGFDGYLVKPVSGEALEEMMMGHIQGDKIDVKSQTRRMQGQTNATAGYNRKIPVVITTSSMCDLPDASMRDPRLPILPFVVKTEYGVFKDGTQIGSDELVRYINDGKNAVSAPPETAVYTEFFAKALKRAHHVIYIALTTSMSEDYNRAIEASKAFDNVTVINSEALSSATGLLVLIACKLAQRDMPVEEIIDELEMVKKKIKCSFIIDSTDFMKRNGRIGVGMHRVAESLSLRPCLRFSDDKVKLGTICVGSKWDAYKTYIRSAFRTGQIPDTDVLFITYVDLNEEMLQKIRKEVSNIVDFEHIVFQRASAAISSNCGPGSFGLLYFLKGDKSYNVSSILPLRTDFNEPDDPDDKKDTGKTAKSEALFFNEIYEAGRDIFTRNTKPKGADDNKPWYANIEGIDGETAITNSGSEESFRTVLEIFYNSIDERARELEFAYKEEDWGNYTIKIHALKSSCKLIGATALAEKAQSLETAGKEENIVYIRDKYDEFMEEYLSYKDRLSDLYSKKSKGKSAAALKPMADSFLMDSVYEAISAAAEDMDSDAIDEAFLELSDYEIPETDKEKFDEIKRLASQYNYDGIVSLLSEEK
ncbi:DegV family protein [Butyrivibrio sp. LC3010]|uniref:DegV family protein n=1 Tax=Butyrivibrio sp. LC3010 TaxID=1280680 RepID=UPI00041C8BFF|nr:DegV family protein [Butyrivibrio sp. LC3010]